LRYSPRGVVLKNQLQHGFNVMVCNNSLQYWYDMLHDLQQLHVANRLTIKDASETGTSWLENRSRMHGEDRKSDPRVTTASRKIISVRNDEFVVTV
jgi:hypothetical protein